MNSPRAALAAFPAAGSRSALTWAAEGGATPRCDCGCCALASGIGTRAAAPTAAPAAAPFRNPRRPTARLGVFDMIVSLLLGYPPWQHGPALSIGDNYINRRARKLACVDI